MIAQDYQVLYLDNLPWKLSLAEVISDGCHHQTARAKMWRFVRHRGDREMIVQQCTAGIVTLSAFVGYCHESERVYLALRTLSQRTVASVSWEKSAFVTTRALLNRVHRGVCDRMNVSCQSRIKVGFGCLFLLCYQCVCSQDYMRRESLISVIHPALVRGGLNTFPCAGAWHSSSCGTYWRVERATTSKGPAAHTGPQDLR